MNFTYKLARRLARLKPELTHLVVAAPAAAVRRLSQSLRFPRHPALALSVTRASDARRGGCVRVGWVRPLGGLLVLGLATCEKPLSLAGPNSVPVASVALSPSSLSLLLGATAQLTATPKDASGNPLSGRSVSWQSNAVGVATVKGTGMVTGIAAGGATITATSEGKSATATVTVSGVPVASVTVSPSAASVVVGAIVQLIATPLGAAATPLSRR